MYKKKVIQMYFVVGISLDQLTQFAMKLTFDDNITISNTDNSTKSQFNKSFKEASSFTKQPTENSRKQR